MSDEKMDKRVRRTRRIIRDALVELMERKPVERITVTELCALADINRNTFYAHYASPEDVLHEIDAEMMEELSVLLRGHPDGDVTKVVLAHVREHRKLYRLLWASGTSGLLEQQITFALKGMMPSWEASTGANPTEVGLFLRFAAAGSLVLVREWVDDVCRESEASVAARINRFISLGRAGLATPASN